MKKLRTLLVKVFFSFCRILLTKDRFDEVYISAFLYSKNLKGLKLSKKIWCFFHGFLPFEYVWYDLKNNDFRNYIPARNNYMRRFLNGSFNAILANKLIFEKHLKTVISGIDKLQVVESIGFIEDGCLKSLHKNIVNGDFLSLIPFLENSDLILKPTIGDGGVGLFIIKKENSLFSINYKAVGLEELVSEFKKLGHYLIQERIKQKGFSSIIYPGSVNTMRIGTMIDPVTQKPFIGYAFHRFGSNLTGFMDNIDQGGISAMIDIESGKLGKGHYFSLTGDRETYETHPISLRPIYNEQIPGWGDLKSKAYPYGRENAISQICRLGYNTIG